MGWANQFVFRDPGQLCQMDAILEMFCQAPSKLESDSCFPNSSGAGNGDEGAFVEQSLDFAMVRRASGQGGQGKRRAGRGRSLHLRRSCFGTRRHWFFCDHSIAEPELGPDHAAICAQRSPNGRHLGLKIVFFDGDPGPDGIEKLILRHQLAVGLREHPKHIEGTRADSDFHTIAQEQAQSRKNAVASEIDALVVAILPLRTEDFAPGLVDAGPLGDRTDLQFLEYFARGWVGCPGSHRCFFLSSSAHVCSKKAAGAGDLPETGPNSRTNW